MEHLSKLKDAQGDLVLVPFPFSNLNELKVRPALIISNNFFNLKNRDFILLPLTSVLKQEAFFIKIGQKDLVSGKLVKPSVIKLNKVFSLEKSKILSVIGKLDKRIFNKVKKEFYRMV